MAKVRVSHDLIDEPLPPVDGERVALCLPVEWQYYILRMLDDLTKPFRHTTESTLRAENLIKLHKVIDFIVGDEQCGVAIPPDDVDEFCYQYDPNSFILNFAPNDPFQTPNFAPDGYPNPPWKAYPNPDDPLNLLGFQDGDVLASYSFDFSPSGFVDLLGSLVTDLPTLIRVGFPRFRVNLQGEGTLELHLLKIPFGGVALIVVDDEISSASTVDLNSDVSELVEAETIYQAIIAVLGFTFTNKFDTKVFIQEVEISGDDPHHIDVYFIPNVSLNAGLVGFGGGLRKIVWCNETLQGVPNQMPQFQVNPTTFQMEWKPTELHTEFEPIGQVIYPITMRVEPDPMTQSPTFQYTLQGIPIGGGADPFVEWRNLIEVQSGEAPQLRLNSETEQPFVEWKYPSESEWTPLFDVPLGIEEVLIEPLPAGSPPFADLTDTTLTLNLPTPLNGNSPLMRVSDNIVQYAISSDENNNPEWINLFELSDLAFQAVWIEAEPAGSEPFTSIFENELTLHLPEAEMVQLRSNETHIQWSYVRELPEDEVWTNLIELVTLKGADGIDGTNGIDGTDGIDGADGDRILHVIANTLSAGSSANANYDALSKTLYLGIPRGNTGLDGECDCDEPSVPYNMAVSNAVRRCNVALGITTWLFNTFQAAVEACEGLTSDAEALTALFGVVEQSKWNSSLLADLANRLRLSDSVTIAALMTETAKENWQKWYNCNGATDGILDPTVWGQYIAQRENILGASAAALLYEDFLLALKTSEVNNQAAIASYETGDCTELSCEWCYTINFNGVNPEYTIVKGIQEASYIRTDFAFYGNESYRFWQVEIPFPATATVTKVLITHDHTLGSFDPVSGSGSSWGKDSYTGGNTVENFPLAALPEPYEWEGETTINTKLWAYCLVGTERQAGQNANGESLLQSITIWGTGANPFGADNC